MIKLALFVLSGIATFILFNMGMDYINGNTVAGWSPSWSIPASFFTCAICIWLYMDANQRSKWKAGEYQAKSHTEH